VDDGIFRHACRIITKKYYHELVTIILVHNHPSGNFIPREADQTINRKRVNAGLLLEPAVWDHLIVTDDGFYLFAAGGALSFWFFVKLSGLIIKPASGNKAPWVKKPIA